MKRKRGKKGKSKKLPVPMVSAKETVENVVNLSAEDNSGPEDMEKDEIDARMGAETPSSTGTDQPEKLVNVSSGGQVDKAAGKLVYNRVKVKIKSSKALESQLTSSDARTHSDTDKSSPHVGLDKQVVVSDKVEDSANSVPEVSKGVSVYQSKKAGSIKIKSRGFSSASLSPCNNTGSAQVERTHQKEPELPRRDSQYNKQELNSALEVIKKIMKMDAAEPFNVPVNPVALGIPDYFDVIDTPMDFGTICSNLENVIKYKNSEDVFNDVRYIWENCYKYNNKGDYILELMKRVKKNFSKYWSAAGLYSEQPQSTSGSLLEAKYPHLYWTPCTAHCLDLILEDLFEIPSIKSVFKKAMKLNSYIYSRPGLLNMMRKFTNLELVRPAKTRFATAFLTLSTINLVKKGLRAMFNSDVWRKSKWEQEQKGKQAARIVMDFRFWKEAIDALKVAGPLVKVLRLVDGEKKPAMGYIYEAMDRAKEVIANNFDNKKEKYIDYFRIIDRRWEDQLHRPLHAAGYYLNPEFFYKNPNIENDKEVMNGLLECIERLVPSHDIQDKISEELTAYKNADGLFGKTMAIRQRDTRSPGGESTQAKDGAPSNNGKIPVKGGHLKQKMRKRHGVKRHKDDCLCAICVMMRRRQEREENAQTVDDMETSDSHLAQEAKLEGTSPVRSLEGTSSSMDNSQDQDVDADLEDKGEEVKLEGSKQPYSNSQDKQMEQMENEMPLNTKEEGEISEHSQLGGRSGEEHSQDYEAQMVESGDDDIQNNANKEISMRHGDEIAAVEHHKPKEGLNKNEKAKIYEELHRRFENPMLLELCGTLFSRNPKSFWAGAHSLNQHQASSRSSSIRSAIATFMK